MVTAHQMIVSNRGIENNEYYLWLLIYWTFKGRKVRTRDENWDSLIFQGTVCSWDIASKLELSQENWDRWSPYVSVFLHTSMLIIETLT